MKNKMILDKYTQPIYIPKDLYVCVNPNFNKLNKIFNLSKFEDASDQFDSCNGVTYYLIKNLSDNKLCMLVILNIESLSKYEDDQAINTIAHEAFHVTNETLNYCGVEFSNHGNESYAYLIGWIAQCIYKTYVKTKK